MQRQVYTLRRRYRLGMLARCEHLRDGEAVGTVLLATWSQAATCMRCRRRHQVSGDLDRTCDACGQVSESGMGIHLIQVGGLLVGVGLCPACHRKEVAA